MNPSRRLRDSGRFPGQSPNDLFDALVSRDMVREMEDAVRVREGESPDACSKRVLKLLRRQVGIMRDGMDVFYGDKAVQQIAAIVKTRELRWRLYEVMFVFSVACVELLI